MKLKIKNLRFLTFLTAQERGCMQLCPPPPPPPLEQSWPFWLSLGAG